MGVGDIATAEQYTAEEGELADTYGMKPYMAQVLAQQGVLARLRGDPRRGAELLQVALEGMRRSNYYACCLLYTSPSPRDTR